MATDGEAKNPGPVLSKQEGSQGSPSWLHLGTANATALTTQLEAIASLPAHVLGVQETRLTDALQLKMKQELKDLGWNVAFGKAMPQWRSQESCKPGGVCVLSVFPIRHVAPCCKDGRWLWDSTRFVHATIDVMGTIWHVLSIYGHTNSENQPEQRAKNEELLTHALRYIAALGQVPVVLCTDLNTTPEASAQLQAALNKGQLWDTGALVAQAQGRVPEPTCFAHETSKGTRRDYIFTNAQSTHLVKGCEVLQDSGIPTHKPVLATFELPSTAYTGKVLRLPRPIPQHKIDPDPGGRFDGIVDGE